MIEIADAGHLSELSLDLLLLGDLSRTESSRARRHIHACPVCSERFAALRSAARHFDENVRDRTAARVVRALMPTAASPPGRRRGWWAPALGALGVGALAIVLARGLTRDDRRVLDDGIRAKGPPALKVFVRHAGRVSSLGPNARVEPGDALRFTADPNGYPYLLIASIDAAQHTTFFVSDGGRASASIHADERFEDAAAFVLDDTRGPERIFALFSKQPIDVAPIRRALAQIGGAGPAGIRRAATLDVAADFQTSQLIEK